MTATASASQRPVERRSETRTPASGEVLLRPYDRSFIRGEVMDVSPSGFRMRYVGKRMRIGSQVDVLQPWSNVRATIAWTIRSGEWIHAGLQLIPAEGATEE